MSIQTDVDRLCEWYTLHKPTVTRIVINATPKSIYKFAGTPVAGEAIRYRGFEIVCGKLAAHVKRMDGTA